ncbi:MAG: hypothetical protein WBB01_26580 [Phormidesmis sp.]
MPRKLVNLTEILVVKGISLTLKTYPYYPYSIAFQSSDTRNWLTQYVLKRIKAIYIPLEPGSYGLLRSQAQRAALKQQKQIRTLIHEGIRRLLPSIVIHYPVLSDPSSLQP